MARRSGAGKLPYSPPGEGEEGSPSSSYALYSQSIIGPRRRRGGGGGRLAQLSLHDEDDVVPSYKGCGRRKKDVSTNCPFRKTALPARERNELNSEPGWQKRNKYLH